MTDEMNFMRCIL